MTNYTQWKSLVDLHEYSAIPDLGLDHFYFSKQLTTIDPWRDEDGSEDLSPISTPSIVSDGINGNQSVLYDGVDDGHESTNPGSLGTDGAYLNVGVFELDAEASGNNTIWYNGEGGTDGIGFEARVDDGDYLINHTGNEFVRGGSTDSEPHVYVLTFDSTNVILDIDGSNVINTTISAPTEPTGPMQIAYNNNEGRHFDGFIGSAGHESAFAGSERRDNITQKLADEFDIATSL